ncbi:MAG: glycosyltransferase [Brevinematales bacterium]|nr:glycosyltransferase [Brevinematales bacterium]
MTDRKERVCVVVVTYNRKELLIECLEAIEKQTHPVYAVYVIDNASQDGTEALLLEKGFIEELPPKQLKEPWEKEFIRTQPGQEEGMKLHYVRMPVNVGGSGGFYEGLRRGYEKGYEWFWLMDDDTIPMQDALATLLYGSQELGKERIGFLCSKVIWTDGSPHIMNIPGISPLVENRPFNLYDEKRLLLVSFSSFVSLLIHKNVVEQVGLPIKSFFIWADDVEYTLRITKKGFLGVYAPLSVVIHKTKQNYSATTVNDKRLFYNIRNWLWIYKLHFKKRFYIEIMKNVIRIPFSPLGTWFLRLKAILQSLWYTPRIEHVKKNLEKIVIFSSSKVYIACPAHVSTGGPELLHQLAYDLRNVLAANTFMYYYNVKDNEDPVSSAYRHYGIPFVKKISPQDDNEQNILIVPEVKEGLRLLSMYKNIRKGVWFLSVDNYYLSRCKKIDFLWQRIVNKISKVVRKKTIYDLASPENLRKMMKKYDYRKDRMLKLASFYMTNSIRGLSFFKDLSPLFYLSEYLNRAFLETETDLSGKQNIVVYNPKKGEVFVNKIVQRAQRRIEFFPLENMTREGVIQTLQRAKVYIDFGNHPGKDRIPREAAILGCCVITGKRGSAAYHEDVPIPEEYKFEDKEENIPLILEKIEDCFVHFDQRYKDFDEYRKIIKAEPSKFQEDMRKIFCVEER